MRNPPIRNEVGTRLAKNLYNQYSINQRISLITNLFTQPVLRNDWQCIVFQNFVHRLADWTARRVCSVLRYSAKLPAVAERYTHSGTSFQTLQQL